MNDEERPTSDEDAAPPARERRPLNDAEKAATCPFVRTLLVNHPDVYDEATRTMSRETLLDFVRAQRAPGGERSMEKVFAFFARTNQTPFTLWFQNLLSRKDLFSTEFPGSRGDHPGSTEIYRGSDGTFDPSAFDRVVAHSSDGTTMNQRDIAAAIIESNRHEANPGSAVDLAKSAGEFALLFNLLGRDDSTMLISDMRMLFEHNTWPPGSLDNLGKATADEWRTLTQEIMRAIASLKFSGDNDKAQVEEAMGHLQAVVDGPMKER